MGVKHSLSEESVPDSSRTRGYNGEAGLAIDVRHLCNLDELVVIVVLDNSKRINPYILVIEACE